MRWMMLAMVTALMGCASDGPRRAQLDEIYGEASRRIGPGRNPVVVIPGILGSNLVDGESGRIVWGAYVHGAADADFEDGARLVALPMQRGASLASLRDGVEPNGVLESLEASVAVFRVTALEPYKGIIRTLGAGRYVDRDIARRAAGGGAVEAAHFTCFQFDYDWRRDISENAARLDRLIREAAALATEARGSPARVDVVAHSMGGLVLMYYLRYGVQALPDDGSPPELTWEGAALVERAILVGTPNAGSVLALRQLVEGVRHSALSPTYRPAVLGTMPSIYQLLPRERHARVVDSAGRPIEGLFRVETWERFGWGLADPKQDRVLRWLLPHVGDGAERRRIALEHLEKCLARAEQLHRALDLPASPPDGTTLSLMLGDAARTPSVLEVETRTGRLKLRETAPGDGTVTRASALMDERLGGGWVSRLRSPIAWDEVRFVEADHIGLTSHPGFTNGLLYTLLEEPRFPKVRTGKVSPALGN